MGTNLEIKVPEDVTRDTSVILQRLLGPVAEGADFLTDKLRFLRWKSMVKTLNRAQEIAAANNIQPNEVPAKFLVPFLENASLEDEDSPLIKGWANLLAAASKSYRDEHHIFTGVLAGLSPSDARKLKQLVEGSVPEKLLIIGSFGGNTYREFFHRKFQQLFDGEPGLSFRDYAELRDQVSTYLAGFGAEPTFVWIDDLKGHAFGGDATSEREFVNLERQRLARVDNYRYENALFGGGIALQSQVNYVQLTDLVLGSLKRARDAIFWRR